MLCINYSKALKSFHSKFQQRNFSTKGKLFLLPNLISDETGTKYKNFFPISIEESIKSLNGLIAESKKEGEKYLSRFSSSLKKNFNNFPIKALNEHTKLQDLLLLLDPILNKQETWGLVSDAGLPCIADPGADLVFLANSRGIEVQTFVGPSSIIMALQLSGLPGQRFSFNGYLAKDPEGRKRELTLLEAVSERLNMTQIFIEAPYRNQYVVSQAIEILKPKTYFCAAWDLTLSTQTVKSMSIENWRKTGAPEIGKRPAVFVIHANPWR